MKIVFMAVDDEFAGSMQRFVYESRAEWVVGSVISTCSLYRKSPLAAFWFVLRHSGLRYGAEMFKMKVVRRLSRATTGPVPSELAKRHGAPIHYSADVNSRQTLQQLRAWSPDVIVATNFSHYVGKEARGIAPMGAWNVHKSYLPHFRGMAPSFHALLNDEATTGATVHAIATGIDTGDIFCQVPVEIESRDTVYTLNQKTSAAGGQALANLLERADKGPVESRPQPAGEWPYYTFPRPDEVRRFLLKGRRF